jgi:hypothetical protein
MTFVLSLRDSQRRPAQRGERVAVVAVFHAQTHRRATLHSKINA